MSSTDKLWAATRATINRLIRLAKKNNAMKVQVYIEDDDGSFQSTWTPEWEKRMKERRAPKRRGPVLKRRARARGQ